MSQTGKTNQNAVRCILRKDKLNSGSVEGELIVDKTFLDLNLGVNLAVLNTKGNLVASWGVEGREIDGKIHYYFSIQQEFIKSSMFSLFTKKHGMMELNLGTLPIQRNP